jgi:hypothetical protein
MASEVDLQVLVFMIFFALATIFVLLTRRRKKKYRFVTRCISCGRTLDSSDRDDLCSDCYRISRF